MPPGQFDRDDHGRVFHLTAKGVATWIVTLLTIISLGGGIGWSLLTVGAKVVRGYDMMSHAIEQNTRTLSDLSHQMAANLDTSSKQINRVAAELGNQIAALSRRTDNIQDRTRMLEINQARVLEALKRQGIVNSRSRK